MKHFHTISFKHAFDGLKHTFINQPNLRIHLVVALVVILAGFIFQFTQPEWVIITFTIMWVIVSEMINTAVEAVCDLVTEEFHRSIKIAKDVAAGMVLVGAIGSVVIGLLIFIPHIISAFTIHSY